MEIRELPGGARQSERKGELTSERLPERRRWEIDDGCVGADGTPAVERGKALCSFTREQAPSSAWQESVHEIEWYRAG